MVSLGSNKLFVFNYMDSSGFEIISLEDWLSIELKSFKTSYKIYAY